MKSNNFEAVRIQKKIMTITGQWPERGASWLYKIYGLISYLLIVALPLSLLLNNFLEEDKFLLIRSWSMFITFFNCALKLTIFRFKTSAFLNILNFLKSPHFHYYDEELDPHLSRMIWIAVIMVKTFLCCGLATLITTIIMCLAIDFAERPTPLPSAIKFKELPLSQYLTFYAFQCVSMSLGCLTSLGFDNLPNSLMSLSIGYFEILTETVKRLSNFSAMKVEMGDLYGKFDKEINKKLGECVEHHLAVIEFTVSIEEIFSYIFLSQFLCGTVGLCLAVFACVNSEPGSLDFINALIFLATLTVQISMYCAFGDEVTIQSSRVADALYMAEWIYWGSKVRKSMFIIMERAKRPAKLTAGRFVNLSLDAFVMIMKSGVSYAMVLYQLTNK